MTNRVNISDFNALISFVNDYYQSNYNLVIKAVETSLNCFIISISDKRKIPKDELINKVTIHYNFISSLPNGAEKPIFLISDEKEGNDFDIKNIFKSKL